MTDAFQTPSGRLPPWIRTRLRAGAAGGAVAALLKDLHLATVCEQAHCPNQCECFGQGTATFLILGEICTRNCRFCAIAHSAPAPVREDEPAAVAEAAARLNLRYVVITSVTRDDLPDGGAGHFARTIGAVRQRSPQSLIEVLTPDFRGDGSAIDAVLDAEPDVFNHNIETVPRLYPLVRPQADYGRSLEVIGRAKRRFAGSRRLTKSGLMVGLGETDEEVAATMKDLHQAGCDILTIGQYLCPSKDHLPVARFVEPKTFEAWEVLAREMGFAAAACAPLVRSSYHAAKVFAGRET